MRFAFVVSLVALTGLSAATPRAQAAAPDGDELGWAMTNQHFGNLTAIYRNKTARLYCIG